MTLYCECGSPTQYSGTRPKFCSSCGTPFDKTAANLARAARAREPIVYEEPEPAPPPAPRSSRPAPRPARKAGASYTPPAPVYEEEYLEEIPVFTANTEGEAPQKLTVASLRSQASFSADRPAIGNDPLIGSQLAKAKQDALKNMLNPPSTQVNGTPET